MPPKFVDESDKATAAEAKPYEPPPGEAPPLTVPDASTEQPAPAPAVGYPPSTTVAGEPADAGPGIGQGGGALVAIASYTPPGEPQQYRYGVVLGPWDEANDNPDLPNGRRVLLFPEGCEMTTIFDDAPGVTVV